MDTNGSLKQHHGVSKIYTDLSSPKCIATWGFESWQGYDKYLEEPLPTFFDVFRCPEAMARRSGIWESSILHKNLIYIPIHTHLYTLMLSYVATVSESHPSVEVNTKVLSHKSPTKTTRPPSKASVTKLLAKSVMILAAWPDQWSVHRSTEANPAKWLMRNDDALWLKSTAHMLDSTYRHT